MQNNVSNLRKFEDYELYSAATFERIVITKPVEIETKPKKLSKKKKRRKIKTYHVKSEEWYISHPCQGGGCSGK